MRCVVSTNLNLPFRNLKLHSLKLSNQYDKYLICYGRAWLQIFSKAYDSIGFLKSQGQVKLDAVRVAKLTIAGKLGAALFLCPSLAC